MLHSMHKQDGEFSESRDWVLHEDGSVLDDSSIASERRFLLILLVVSVVSVNFSSIHGSSFTSFPLDVSI
jgi:hypothetical protein